MDKGIYCLVFSNNPCTIQVGSLGPRDFPRGWHAYIGSALGHGGFSRVSRHIRLFSSGSGKRHWHIDYLLTNQGFSLHCAVCAPTASPLECNLARAIGGIPVPHFGSSDCRCPSHLFYFDTNPRDRITSGAVSLGLVPFITTINTLER
jgi:Uri superfamily endonuclease